MMVRSRQNIKIKKKTQIATQKQKTNANIKEKLTN